MRRQARALYEFDARGRIRTYNAPEGKVVDCPVVFLGRTGAGAVAAVRHDVPEPAATELLRLLQSEPDDPGDAPPAHREELRRVVATLAPVAVEWSGPAFRFPATLPEHRARALGPDDAHLLERAFPKLAGSAAARAPILAITEGDDVLSACYAATGAGPYVEAGVDTVEGARGRGLAPVVVAAWAAAVRRAGREPLYSTAWDNHASRRVAAKLGLIAYGSDWHLRVRSGAALTGATPAAP